MPLTEIQKEAVALRLHAEVLRSYAWNPPSVTGKAMPSIWTESRAMPMQWENAPPSCSR